MFHHCSTVYCEQWEFVYILTIYQFYSEITNKTYIIEKICLNLNAVRIVLFVKSMCPKNITTSNFQRNFVYVTTICTILKWKRTLQILHSSFKKGYSTISLRNNYQIRFSTTILDWLIRRRTTILLFICYIFVVIIYVTIC